MRQLPLASTMLKTTAVHTVTYFLVGVLPYLFLDYAAKYGDPACYGKLCAPNRPSPGGGAKNCSKPISMTTGIGLANLVVEK